VISAFDGVGVPAVGVEVGVGVDVEVLVEVGSLVDVDVGTTVGPAVDAAGDVVAAEDADAVGEVLEVVDSDGKNGSHCASAADACRRSAVMSCCALVTRCWAWARLVPAPFRPDEPATRGLVVGVDVATGVEPGVVVAARKVLLVLLVLLVPVVAVVVVLWSDSRVALAFARDAVAEMTALCSGAGSRLANASPAVTASPTATETLETVPVTAKPWLTWLTRLADPVRLRRCSTEPVVTVVVR